MELKFECTVSHGAEWVDGVRCYTNVLKVDLSDQEVVLVKNVLRRREGDASFDALKELPMVYNKIEKVVRDFKEYTFILDTCVHWNSEKGDVREEDLINEDIESGKFHPLYTNMEGSSMDSLIMNQWFVEMIHGLSNLSYRERKEYLMKRYQISLEDLHEIDFETSYRLL